MPVELLLMSVAPVAFEVCKSKQVLHLPCVELTSFSQVSRCCADTVCPIARTATREAADVGQLASTVPLLCPL